MSESNGKGRRAERPPNHSGIRPKTAEWLEKRAWAFANATSRAPGKPADGLTYGKGQKAAK